MIQIGIDPILLHFGGHFAIRWYSLIVVTALGVVLWLATKEAVRRGLDEDEFSNLAFLAIPFGIIGARLFHVIDHWPDEYAANPIRALYLWEGGLAVWGAVIGGGVALAVFAWAEALNLGLLADIAAPGSRPGTAGRYRRAGVGPRSGYRAAGMHHHRRRGGKAHDWALRFRLCQSRGHGARVRSVLHAKSGV